VKIGKNFITENRSKGVGGNGLEALGKKGLRRVGGGGGVGKNLITWSHSRRMGKGEKVLNGDGRSFWWYRI